MNAKLHSCLCWQNQNHKSQVNKTTSTDLSAQFYFSILSKLSQNKMDANLHLNLLSKMYFTHKHQQNPFDHWACAEHKGGDAGYDDEAVEHHSQVYLSCS